MFDYDRAEQLIQRHLDQLATVEELAELDRLVIEQPAVAESLLEAARVDALLTMHLHGTRPEGVVDRAQGPHPERRRRFALVIVATAATLLFAVGLWRWLDVTAGHTVLAGTIEVNGIRATRIVDGAPLRVVGERSAVIQLAGGAQAELQTSTAAVIRRPDGSQRQVVELLEGGGHFHVPHQADRPFSVQTCSGSVTAVGTDFEVNLWPTQGKGDQEMSFRSMFVLAVAVAAGVVQVDVPGQQLVLPAGSQKVFGADAPKVKKAGDWQPSGAILGFTGKGGQPFALEQIVPGIQGALALTDAQKTKIAAAADQTIHSEKVRAAMTVAKLNPNATEAQKEESRKVLEEARAKLQQQVGEVLTAEQKALIPQINTAVDGAQKQALSAMEAELSNGKGDAAKAEQLQKQLRQKTCEAVQARLEKVLTPAQLASYKKAAEAQLAAEKAAKDKPKGADKPKGKDKPKAADTPKSQDKPKGDDKRTTAK